MEQAYWLAWSQIPGIGPILLKRLHQEFSSLYSAWNANSKQLAQVEGLGEVSIEKIINARFGVNPNQLWEAHCLKNPHLWTPADPEYPRILWEIADPPPLLYWAGSLKSWDHSRAIAIVGTREPTIYGRRWARKIGLALAENGYVVVSGLADGIDAEAHSGCLEANGQAIAVVGTGVDRVYPAKNQAIYQKLLRSGLVVSEYPQGTGPERSHFPQRNRIIAGLCRATILIEAAARSGALITTYQANEYGREVYALPGSLDFEQSRGCLEVIQRGGQIIMGINELLASLGNLPNLDKPQDKSLDKPLNKPLENAIDPSKSVKKQLNLANLSNNLASKRSPIPEIIKPEIVKDRKTNQVSDPSQNQILNLLDQGAIVGFDAIVEQLNLGSGEISGALLQLELLGLVAQHPGMRYQRII
jgi:DNA processing protein